MTLRKYAIAWLVVSTAIVYEYLMLNSNPSNGLLGYAKQTLPAFRNLNLSPDPGRPISLFLGWAGIGIMALTNLYVLRKRIPLIRNRGTLSGWLDFHIFCGLMGPTLIVFHTNFHVRGLVAVSFWSMVIVALSGVVGRYFYIQVIRRKVDLEKEAGECERQLGELQKSAPGLGSEVWERAKERSLRFVGGEGLMHPASDPPGFFGLLAVSLVGDFRLAFGSPRAERGMPQAAGRMFRQFAIARRRVLFFDTFKQYLGYWHAFHLPFAYFMYVIAAVHIATALMFGVKH